MKRRTLIAAFGASAMARPYFVRAQPVLPLRADDRVPLIGLIVTEIARTPFQEEMVRLGYVEGKTVRYETRSATPADRLSQHAAELVTLKVDMIIASGTEAVRAAQHATKTLPIVMTGSSDPEGTGLVASLGRPGGNTTGLSLFSAELSGKRLELLREIVGSLSRAAVLWNPNDPPAALALAESKDAARVLGISIHAIECTRPEEFGVAFLSAVAARAEAVVILSSPLMATNTRILGALALQHRLPSVFWNRAFAADGGLLSYGPDGVALARRAAIYVDKILRGASPAELPVERPDKFQLVINLKTAKALGLTIPPSLLARTDEVIE